MATLTIPAGPKRERLPADWETMPFRYLFGPKANLAILLTLFVLLVGFVCTLLILARAFTFPDPRLTEVGKLVGLCTTVGGVLVLLINQQATANYLHKSKHETLGALNQQSAKIEEIRQTAGANLGDVAREVRAAERHQMIDDPRCLEAMEKVAARAAEEAAERAARKVLDALRPKA